MDSGLPFLTESVVLGDRRRAPDSEPEVGRVTPRSTRPGPSVRGGGRGPQVGVQRALGNPLARERLHDHLPDRTTRSQGEGEGLNRADHEVPLPGVRGVRIW